jgi:YegS/Rv2252/BmrU family lipid kinase
MQTRLIINPVSGRAGARRGAGDARARLARALLDAHPGLDVEIVLTRARGHGRELAEACVARGVDRVIAWGGDGTVNEIAGPLIGTSVELGIVPSGSGDGLARSLGLPRRPRLALATALAGAATAIDVGWMGGRHFLNVGGVGFDATIACAFNDRTRRGGLGYVTGGLTSVWSYRCGSYELEIDGQRLSGPRFLVAFANGRQYGNGVVIAPDADLRDGWLNAIVVAGGSPLRQFWRARRLAIGRLRAAEGVLRVRVQRARVSAERLVCHVDGETFEAGGDLDVTVMPQALRVVGPAEPPGR